MSSRQHNIVPTRDSSYLERLHFSLMYSGGTLRGVLRALYAALT